MLEYTSENLVFVPSEIKMKGEQDKLQTSM